MKFTESGLVIMAIVAALGVLALEASAGSASPRPTSASACPATQTQRTPLRPIGLLDGIRLNVPRAYADLTNQDGTPGWRGYQVLGVLSLAPGYEDVQPSEAAHYRRIATRRCGARVARQSWAVLLQFPNAASALLGYGISFFVRTMSGWTLWHRQR